MSNELDFGKTEENTENTEGKRVRQEVEGEKEGNKKDGYLR